MTGPRRAGLAALLIVAPLIVAPSAADLAQPAAAPAAPSSRPAPRASVAIAPTHHLLVIDFLAYAAGAVDSDPIPGSPDAEDLIAHIGDPSAFGADVSDQVDADADASGRCGVIELATVEALASALNPRLPADQQIDLGAATSRSLLHWAAGEGYASVRIFAQDARGSPSCTDAGTRF